MAIFEIVIDSTETISKSSLNLLELEPRVVDLFSFYYPFCIILLFSYEAELQRQQQQFVAQKLIAAQRHVAVSQPPQPQKATIVYRSQQVPSNDPATPKVIGEARQRGRTGRHHDGRYTSGKLCLHELFSFLILACSFAQFLTGGSGHGSVPVPSIATKKPISR